VSVPCPRAEQKSESGKTPQLLRQFETLDEPVTSPSGARALSYDVDGRGAIRGCDGTTTWAVGAAGVLRLELEGVFALYDGGQVV
jgi:hypothetical protein